LELPIPSGSGTAYKVENHEVKKKPCEENQSHFSSAISIPRNPS